MNLILFRFYYSLLFCENTMFFFLILESKKTEKFTFRKMFSNKSFTGKKIYST